jgi:hypothetical protein
MWLNTINSQYFLALAAVVILLEPPAVGRARRWTYAAVVAVAGLSGPVAAFVAPLFVLKGWRTRSRPVLMLGIVAALCTLVQVSVIALGGAGSLGVRARGLSGLVFALLVSMRTVVLPLFGSQAALAFVGRFDPASSGFSCPRGSSARSRFSWRRSPSGRRVARAGSRPSTHSSRSGRSPAPSATFDRCFAGSTAAPATRSCPPCHSYGSSWRTSAAIVAGRASSARGCSPSGS